MVIQSIQLSRPPNIANELGKGLNLFRVSTLTHQTGLAQIVGLLDEPIAYPRYICLAPSPWQKAR